MKKTDEYISKQGLLIEYSDIKIELERKLLVFAKRKIKSMGITNTKTVKLYLSAVPFEVELGEETCDILVQRIIMLGVALILAAKDEG